MPIHIRTKKGKLIPVALNEENIAVEVSDQDGSIALVLYCTGKDQRAIMARVGDKELHNYIALFKDPPKIVADYKEVKLK